jgi:predicted ATPase/class 3 adenylate cyclase
MTEIQALIDAIAALESQRALLGDAVVETALEPMRQQLATLQAQPVENQRKQVTVLFAQVSDLTASSEGVDAEEVHTVVNVLWQQLDAVIITHGGAIDKHIGNGVMALWGVQSTREDDPERAIKAALALRATLNSFREKCRMPLAVRIGLNTGPVLLGEVGSTREFTAMGDTVNLAARMEQAAPVNGILITHATYRHVRGVFDVQAQPPLNIKGKTEAVQTYGVQGLKPRTFWVTTRGIEGIETRMVGRDAELKCLQAAFGMTVAESKLQMVTVVAEAGMGKSRLLREFDAWSKVRSEYGPVIKGRSSQEMQAAPYALLRDALAFYFQIHDSDPLEIVREKIEAGLGAALQQQPVSPPDKTAAQSFAAWSVHDTPARAHLIGHLLGFDLHDSPYLKGVLEDAQQVRDRAILYLVDYFKALTAHQPVVMLLEDIHWADDSSLDVLEQMLRMLPRHRMLVICAARPTLFERRPHWASNQAFHTRLDLSPLSQPDSQTLVDEILQKVDAVPAALRDLVVSNAAGNPFYMEELLKMLIEDGVVVKEPERWRVNSARLASVRVPPTLTAVLQARFDMLPNHEKVTLQRASVFGLTFWAEAVNFIAQDPELSDATPALAALNGREMVFQSETSTFATTDEYIFKHALLRDATYESVLKRDRRIYHARAAGWLLRHSSARETELVGMIAEHLERSAQAEQAVQYLSRAGAGALRTYAYREAADYLKRALVLLPAESAERVPLLVQSGEALWYLGEYEQAQTLLLEGLVLGREHGQDGRCADALVHLGGIARKQGDWAQARAYLTESLAIARRLGAQSKIAHALYSLGWLDIRQGTYRVARGLLAESRAIYQALGDRRGLADALNGLGTAALNLGEYEQTRALYQESLSLFHEVSDRPGESATLVNLGEAARRQGDYPAARQYYEAALKIDHEIGNELLAAMTLGNLGHTALACKDYATAEGYYRKGLQTAVFINDIPDILDILSGLAGVLAQTNRMEQALMILGLVLHHPGLEDESRPIAEQTLAALQVVLPPDVVEAGLVRGRGQPLETAVIEVTAETKIDRSI